MVMVPLLYCSERHTVPAPRSRPELRLNERALALSVYLGRRSVNVLPR